MAWYWLKNAGDGSHFARRTSCSSASTISSRSVNGATQFLELCRAYPKTAAIPTVRASFQKTMSGNFDNANGAPFTPLELFVMELFRVISPNGGSHLSNSRCQNKRLRRVSAAKVWACPLERHSYISTPHTSTSLDPVHWKDPNAFDPQRYLSVPTSAQITEDKCRQIGLARCPFDITNFEVKDGRKAEHHE